MAVVFDTCVHYLSYSFVSFLQDYHGVAQVWVSRKDAFFHSDQFPPNKLSPTLFTGKALVERQADGMVP